MLYKLLFVFCLLEIFEGVNSSVFWEDLRCTWGDPSDPNTYAKLPRTVYAATLQNWTINSQNCENNQKFYGWRLFDSDGPEDGIALLYDNKGVIAGLQSLILQKQVLKKPHDYRFDLSGIYQNETINGNKYFVITAYFREPSRICKESRSDFDLIKSGTGTGLYFQDVTVDKIIPAPWKRVDATKQNWTPLNCFRGMGHHNNLMIETIPASKCTIYSPVFLLYNNDYDLVGFGYYFPGIAESKRFEPANWEGISTNWGRYFQPCFKTQIESVGMTTFHFYFIEDPHNALICPKDYVRV